MQQAFVLGAPKISNSLDFKKGALFFIQRLAAFSRNAWNLNFNMMSVCQDKDFI
jgi:hypothetical protein